MYGLDQLCTKVHTYLLKNIRSLSRLPTYRQLPPDKVFSVLNSDELEVESENEVYEAALHYHYTPEQVEKDQVCLQVRATQALPCGPVCGQLYQYAFRGPPSGYLVTGSGMWLFFISKTTVLF